jgi:hypothetical protein
MYGGKVVTKGKGGSIYLFGDYKTRPDGYCARHCQGESDVLFLEHDELGGR